MSTPSTFKEMVEDLERMVDRTSLGTVLCALAEVCALKSEHVAANWQDRALSALWGRFYTRITKAEEAAKANWL